ncbi:MAG: DUF4384 domain-containing protein [Oscillatoria princeps RMCB-10]|jgi:hypothetical protein|nr:DUF4384 domain-containing protein [Oscillatoria princeps RMCB-10]
MTLPSYEEYEGQFLEAMATHFGFTGKNLLIFEKRFLQDNAGVLGEQLASTFETKLIEGTKNGDASRIFRQQLSAICDKLEAAGCPPTENPKDRWKNAKRWLREVKFPEWAKEQGLVEPPPERTPDQLWEQLKDKATPTEKMGPVLVQRGPTLDMWTTPSQYPQYVPLGSQIRFEVNLESGGYLLLLEKGTSGKLWCLCPSFLAPQPHQPAGVATLPQEKSRQKLLTISGMAGKEEIVALIAKESPPLDWLPQGTQPPLQLKKDHLNDLLAYLNRRPDCQVLYTEYTVTP